MYPSHMYFIELKWRFFYVLLSFIITFIIALSSIDLILLFEVYPFIKCDHKKFIATHITELFNSVFYASWGVSYVLTFPVLIYHTSNFFSNSWYVYQKFVFVGISYLLYATWILSFIIIYTNLLPQTFEFFKQWESKIPSSLFQVTLDTRIQYYLLWVNNVYNFISFLLSTVLVTLLITLFFVSPRKLYINLKIFRRIIVLMVTSFALLFIPPDIFLQIMLFLLNFSSFELLFFVTCFRYKRHLL